MNYYGLIFNAPPLCWWMQHSLPSHTKLQWCIRYIILAGGVIFIFKHKHKDNQRVKSNRPRRNYRRLWEPSSSTPDRDHARWPRERTRCWLVIWGQFLSGRTNDADTSQTTCDEKGQNEVTPYGDRGPESDAIKETAWSVSENMPEERGIWCLDRWSNR